MAGNRRYKFIADSVFILIVYVQSTAEVMLGQGVVYAQSTAEVMLGQQVVLNSNFFFTIVLTR